MRYLLLTLLASTLPLCAADPSPEIQQVLKERAQGPHNLKLNDLTGAKPTPEQEKRLSDKSSHEKYDLPYPKGAADHYAFAVYRFNATGEIWIIRSGGFAGRTELFVVTKSADLSPTFHP